MLRSSRNYRRQFGCISTLRTVPLAAPPLMLLASILVATVLFAGALFAAVPSQAEDDGIARANELSQAFAKVADKITPSVVSVMSVTKSKVPQGKRGATPDPFFEPYRDFFGDDLFEHFFQGRPEGRAQQGLGTGVIVDNDGHILTNNHVVGDADEVTVRLQNEKTYKAKIVGTDSRTDLAVIQIKAPGLVPAKLGDSDQLKIGEWVVASGNPFGLNNSITAGIVSAKGRSFMGGGQYEDFIQTDAAINPGNSGGPLVDLHGDVIGINTAIFSRSGGYMGIGFAIPINMARNVLRSLIDKGKVVRGWLGVGIQNLSEDLSQSFNYESTDGALVGQIEPKGPAAKANLRQGDIITAINGEKIRNVNQLRNMVASIEPGTSISIDLYREGQKEQLKLRVGELPSQGEAQEEPEESGLDLGMNVENLTPDLGQQLGSKKGSGVVVTQVRPGGLAESAGLQPRDIIVSINGKALKGVTEFNESVTASALKKGLRLVVETQGMERFVFLRSDE